MAQVPAIPGTVAIIQLVPIVEALSEMDVDVPRLLGRVGVSMDDLCDVHGRIPCGVEFAVWDEISHVTQDPLIALRVVARFRIGALGAYEYLLRNSPTMRSAVERANRFERLVDDLTRVSLVEDAEFGLLRMWREGGYPHPPRGVECVFGVLLRLGRELFPAQQVIEVRFSHPAPADPQAFEEAFGCPVRFQQAHDEMVFPRAALDAPLQGADLRLGLVLEEHLERLLAQVPKEDPFVHRARRVLLASLAGGTASLERLAASLGVSPRTLRRRLDEHGTSYKQLLNDLRRELALHCVGATDEPFEQVALRLGFAEPSTFYRAFKRWSGTTPALYRAGA